MTKAAKKGVAEYLKKPYARILIPCEGGFSAEILEFPGCFAEGETPNETFEALESAAQSWVTAALEQGQEIPEPSASQGYSGKIALRLPKSIHRQAARMAERDDTSLNQFLLTSIAARVGAEEFCNNLIEKFRTLIPTTVNITAMFMPTITGYAITTTPNPLITSEGINLLLQPISRTSLPTSEPILVNNFNKEASNG